MIIQDRDPWGLSKWMVVNNQGLCLVSTTDGRLAKFVEYHVRQGVAAELRLLIGGDPGSANTATPIWHHVRRISR